MSLNLEKLPMTRDRNKESRPTSTTEQNLDKNKG
jgi:hypothetical protein